MSTLTYWYFSRYCFFSAIGRLMVMFRACVIRCWVPSYNHHYTTMTVRHRVMLAAMPLRWRHNEHDDTSNHQPHGCLLNRLFRRRSKKTSKLRVTGLCAGNSPGQVNSPHKWPVTRKMFTFDDVIMAFHAFYMDLSSFVWMEPLELTGIIHHINCASIGSKCALCWSILVISNPLFNA